MSGAPFTAEDLEERIILISRDGWLDGLKLLAGNNCAGAGKNFVESFFAFVRLDPYSGLPPMDLPEAWEAVTR